MSIDCVSRSSGWALKNAAKNFGFRRLRIGAQRRVEPLGEQRRAHVDLVRAGARAPNRARPANAEAVSARTAKIAIATPMTKPMESAARGPPRREREHARARAPRSAGEPTLRRSETLLPRSVLQLAPLDKRPRLPRLRASSPIPRLRHKLHSDCRLNARITTIRILVQIFVQSLTTRQTQKMWPKGGGRIGARPERDQRRRCLPSPSGRR